MNSRTDAIINEIEKVIIGKRNVVERVLMAILSEGHILLDDVPGTGKTTLALTCSVVMGVQYQRMQFTPDVVPSDIVGFSVYNKATGGFDYKPGVVMTNLLLADEINRTSSKTQSALLEVMEEGQVTVDGVTHQLPKPFVVIATQNPVGSAGTQLLPQAQLDRFVIRLQMGYPDFKSQVEILRDRQKVNPLDHISKVISGEDIIAMQQEVRDIHVEDSILEYVTALATATREHELIRLGVSPRGALAIVRMAKQIRSLGKEQELMLRIFTDLYKYLVSPFRLPSGEIAHPGKKKVLRTFLFHHLELTRKEFRVSEIINHMPAFHVVAGIAICTPHCATNDDIHVLNLIFDTNTHDFCHSSRFFLMRSRHSSNRIISSSEKPL